MLSRSFLYFVTLALATHAFKSHLLEARHHRNAVALQARCSTGPQRSPPPSTPELSDGIPALPRSDDSVEDPTLSLPSSYQSKATILDPPPEDGDDGSNSDSDPTTGDEDESTIEGRSQPNATDTSVLIGAKSAASLTPNGIKAGIAGGDAYPFLKDHIGWWYDWSPNPFKPGSPIAVPMLWGGGTVDAQDAARLATFKKITKIPKYVLGFEEPDCPPGSGSAGMTIDAAVTHWEKWIAPMKAKGAKLVSPSMCKQADETWLAAFQKKIKTPWDITAIHINKNNLAGVKKDIDHYSKYKKPIWVTEFACVNDNPNFIPCTNQADINKFITDIVPYLESDSRVFAYAYSNGLGLGNVWPLTTKDGKPSASGKAYLAAISKFH